ncbi:MAG: RidA family protein [Hyphomicrobium sp.]|jgi:enamine deaminase RidA (YjgF/YER057c/UK114 family)
MTGRIGARLAELGIVLPKQAAPAGAYVPSVVVGELVFVSGQLPILDGELKYTGRVGAELTVAHGYAAARLCGLNLLAQLRAVCDGDFDRVKRVIKLGGFVYCTAGFTEHPKVVNGVSDLMMEVFGEAGRHARIAVGAPALPLGAAVEVDGVFQVG